MAHGGDLFRYNQASPGEWLDFSANIAPGGTPPEILTAYHQAAAAIDSYPDPDCTLLSQCLAQRLTAQTLLSAESLAGQMVWGNGAAELLYRLIGFLRPKTALLPVPSFTEYEKALTEGQCLISFYKMPDLTLHEDILDALDECPDLLILCSPNNPTGTPVPPGLLRQITERCIRNGTALLLDESFIEFAPEGALPAAYWSAPGVFVLRSLTKFYAIPGLRLGVLLCAAPTAQRLRQWGAAWAVSAPAQAAGAAALALERREMVQQTAQERQRLRHLFTEMGFGVPPAAANFLLLRTAGLTDLRERLLTHRLLIRQCDDFRGLSAADYRVAVRTPAENTRLIRAMDCALHGGAAGSS